MTFCIFTEVTLYISSFLHVSKEITFYVSSRKRFLTYLRLQDLEKAFRTLDQAGKGYVDKDDVARELPRLLSSNEEITSDEVPLLSILVDSVVVNVCVSIKSFTDC